MLSPLPDYSYTGLVREPSEAALIACIAEYLAMPEVEKCKETFYDLRHFVAYLRCFVSGVYITDIDRRHIQAFVDYRSKELEEKPATVHRRYYKVKGFFNYLEFRYKTKGYVSPFFKITLPKKELPTDHSLSKEDITKIKAYIPTIVDRTKRLRVDLKYNLAFDFGARPMDIKNITVAHLDLSITEERDYGLVVELTRKGGFVQTLPISKRTIQLIKHWLPIRQRILKDSGIFRFESLPQEIQDQYPLFPSAYNNKLKDRMQPEQFKISDRTVFAHMVDTAIDAGVKLTPMQIRHTFAHDLLDATNDLRLVQAAMGHTDIKTTLRYTGTGTEKIQKSVEMCNWAQREAA